MKFGLGMLMGVIILLADIYWMYISSVSTVSAYGYSSSSGTMPLILGAIILVADLIWIALEMKASK